MFSLYQQIRPCPELSRYIDCYYVFNDEGLFRGKEVTTLDNGITEMMIHLGDSTVFYNKNKSIRNQYRISLTGQYLDEVVMQTTGNTHIISVNFKPGGMYAVFGIPQDYFESNNINLGDIEPGKPDLLWEELMTQKDTAAKIRVLENYLIRHIRQNKQPITEMSQIAEYIKACKGNVSIQSLAGMTGMSVRTFTRRFRIQVGVTPKQYAEIMRLNSVCADMVNPVKNDLLSIALQHGYYDASHLINTFKNYLHVTPSEFTTQLLKDGDYTGKFTLVDL